MTCLGLAVALVSKPMNAEQDAGDRPAAADVVGIGWQQVAPAGEVLPGAGTGKSPAEQETAGLPRDAGHPADADQPGDAGRLADAGQPGDAGQQQAGASRKARRRSTVGEFAILVTIALVVALVIKTFVAQMFYIPTGSMENTLIPGDKVLVSKLTYDFRSIQPGDIVVFNGAGSWTRAAPSRPSSNPVVHAYDVTLRPVFRAIAGLFSTAPGQTDFIKRVIGVPGDHVVCCNARGLITVNGVPLHERSYLYPGAAPSAVDFNITVPAGRLWVMGDNRAVSDDSRGHMMDPGGGTIPESKVIGRAFAIAWPPSRWRILPIPATFGQPGIARQAAAAGNGRVLPADSADSAGVRLRPAAPLLPLAAGLITAAPVTLIRRRLGRRRG